jgi:predicted MFS family arabinose efflux permease
VGALGSAGLAPRIARRLGIGRTFIVSVVIAVAAYTFLPLAHGAVAMAMGFLVIQQLIGDSALMLFNINERTLRQSVAPDDVLGRVNAAMQLLTLGIYPIGALVCGLVAQNLGVRATLAAAISGIAVASLWLIASPLPKLREAPAQPGAR